MAPKNKKRAARKPDPSPTVQYNRYGRETAKVRKHTNKKFRRKMKIEDPGHTIINKDYKTYGWITY